MRSTGFPLLSVPGVKLVFSSSSVPEVPVLVVTVVPAVPAVLAWPRIRFPPAAAEAADGMTAPPTTVAPATPAATPPARRRSRRRPILDVLGSRCSFIVFPPVFGHLL
jgi:hypothetical protein